MKKTALFCLCLVITLGSACRSDNTTSKSKPAAPKPSMTELTAAELYADYYSQPTTTAQIEQNQIIDYVAENNLSVLRSPTGLYYQITRAGTGQLLERGDAVTAHYKGYFLDGKIFDSSYERGQPIQFKVGQMVSGFNEVCYYLRRGGAATVLIPSRLAYGSEGMQDIIPPNTPLAFDIEILASK